jgi:hypothetical protein
LKIEAFDKRISTQVNTSVLKSWPDTLSRSGMP